jgi:hypothetical protein
MGRSLTDRYDDRRCAVVLRPRGDHRDAAPVCCADGMTRYLNAKGIRIFDYPEFMKALRDRVRACAASLASEAGVAIEHIGKPHIRKEEVVARVLGQRGDHSGLVHIVSAMEACDAYQPWHDKRAHETFVRPDSSKCLHYYFRLQFYILQCNRSGDRLSASSWARTQSSMRMKALSARM